MQHYFVTLFFCLLYATGFSQYPLSSGWHSLTAMELSGSVRSMKACTHEAVRDSSGNLIPKPGTERLKNQDAYYDWSPEGNILTASYGIAHMRITKKYCYRNGLLTTIENYGPPSRFVFDSIEKKRLDEQYPDSLVLSTRTTCQYDFRKRLSKTTESDEDGSISSEEHYYYRNDRLEKTRDRHLGNTIYRYDNAGNLVSMTETYDRTDMQRETRYTYEKGVLASLTTEDLSGEIVLERWIEQYDSKGSPISRVVSRRNRTTQTLEEAYNATFANDANGQPVLKTLMRNGEPHEVAMSYVYDEHGNWIRKTTIDGDQLFITERTILYY